MKSTKMNEFGKLFRDTGLILSGWSKEQGRDNEVTEALLILITRLIQMLDQKEITERIGDKNGEECKKHLKSAILSVNNRDCRSASLNFNSALDQLSSILQN